MKFACILACALSGAVAPAHDIITTNLTYTRDISRIFARHCFACHATGSSIPLTTYDEVRPWAVGIKEQVLSRSMPPWGAAKGFGNLSPDEGLGQEDIMIIAAWVVGGAPQGSALLLPARELIAKPVTMPQLQDKLIVETRQRLGTAMVMAGMRPLASERVRSARVIAKLPDGRIEPLVWLFNFDPKFAHSFQFREPLALPAGTVVESSAPLRFALECAAKAP